MAETLQQAMAFHQQGKLSDAERVYRALLKNEPLLWDAWHLFGVLLCQRNELVEGIAAIEKAIQGNDRNPLYHFNLAHIYQTHARSDESIAHYRQAIAIRPDYRDAYINLLAVLMAEKRYGEAEELCRTLLQKNPGLAFAHYSLGNVYVAQGDDAAAMKEYEAALQAKPDYIEALFNMGNACKRKQLYGQAIHYYQKALTYKHDMSGVKVNLADTLLKTGAVSLAIALLDEVIASGVRTAKIYCRLGIACEEKGLHERALQAYDTALGVDDRCIPAYVGKGQVYDVMHRTDEAISAYRQALEVDEGNGWARLYLGNALASAGDAETAETVYRKFLQDNPGSGNAYYLLSLIKKYSVDDPDCRAMEALLESEDISDIDVMGLCFALGKAREDCGAYDEAFAYYARANDLQRKQFDYSTERDRQRYERLVSVFTPALVEEKKGLGMSGWRPVFVVGMPRSGTTLVESILSAHSQLQGVGELDDLRQVLAPDYDAFKHVASLDEAGIKALAQHYRQRTDFYTGGALRPVDKLPSNFWRIGFIKFLFPNAVIIHCCRDPLDTCVSICKYYFSGAHQYAYTQEELGEYYRIYQKVMAFWHELFPGEIYDVCYEKIVTDPIEESKRLVDICGLDWEESCGEFYRHSRAVKTVSLMQVRRPVYTTSVAAWRRYERHIGVLMEKLGDNRRG